MSSDDYYCQPTKHRCQVERSLSEDSEKWCVFRSESTGLKLHIHNELINLLGVVFSVLLAILYQIVDVGGREKR